MKKHPVDGAHARARTLRQNKTEAERRVWQILRSHRMTGYQFRRQAPIGRYIADFVCPTLCARGARLIVEIDGGNTTARRPGRPSEVGSCKTKDIAFCGFGITKSWQIIDGVHETIAEELGRITPTQTLPHRGGGLQGENNVHGNDTDGVPPSAS